MEREGLRRAVDLLAAGDWQQAHVVVQEDEDDPLACWAHAVVHLMEGDEWNAGYWFRRARRAPAAAGDVLSEIEAPRAALAQ